MYFDHGNGGKSPPVGLAFLLAAVLVTPLCQAQSIFTYAGGASIDGRPATTFPLTEIRDVVVDATGALYIADTEAFRVMRVDPETGIIMSIAGNGASASSGDGGPATAASLEPIGLAVDKQGNLFVIDAANALNPIVRRVDAATGVIMTVAGGGARDEDGVPATEFSFHNPDAIDVDSRGNLYIAELGGAFRVEAASGRIYRVAGGGSSPLGDGGPATAAILSNVEGVAIDEARGVLYLADARNDRIRVVNLESGMIDTVAGGGASTDEGIPARQAEFLVVRDVAVDERGDVFVVDEFDQRIRKVDVHSGLVWTVAGSLFSDGFAGDGGPATAAHLNFPEAVGTSPDGSILIADTTNRRVRRVDGQGAIHTVAGVGEGGFVNVGDGGPATAATLFTSHRGNFADFNGIAVDSGGNLFVADPGNYRVRRVDRSSGDISTVAGNSRSGQPQTGVPATESSLNGPNGLAIDAQGNLYLADSNAAYRVDASTGILSKIAGGFTSSAGLALDGREFLFVSDWVANQVHRIDLGSGTVEAIAGNGSPSFGGDGGPATAASLFWPRGVATDDEGNLYIADTSNDRIRRVDRVSGIITTVAGSGPGIYDGDGIPAIEATIDEPSGVAVDSRANIFFSERFDSRVHRVEASSGLLVRLVGREDPDKDFYPIFGGDNGPARNANVAHPEGIAVTPMGDVFIADTSSNRVRVIYRCVDIPAPVLTSPAAGSAGLPRSTVLRWDASPAAFRYDVYLDVASPPSVVAASDIEATTFSPSNLEPLTTYYWKIVAKGDPFCDPYITRESEIRGFTTEGTCDAPDGVDGD